jgi:ABC-2 type transport system ATP-binding protein
LIETPAFYPYLSGRDNLRLRARLLRNGDKGTYTGRGIEEVLDLVGLSKRADDRFKKYSLGMRQRLGIAAALLGEPELLLLDEPTNGLDPRGITEIRQLIQNLGSRGDTTMVVSSHLLSEVEQVCTRFGIINGGKLVHESGIEEVRVRHRTITVRAEPSKNVGEAAERVGLSVIEEVVPEGVVRLTGDEEAIPLLAEHLVRAGTKIREIRLEHSSLEQTYLNLTGEEPSV